MQQAFVHIQFFNSNLILFNDSEYMYHVSIDSLSKLQLQSKRLVTMSASLCTQTGLHCLIIQVLNTRVYFIDIWCASLTSVHYNLEHGLATLTESFSPLNLNYTTSLVKVQTRSDMTSHGIPWSCTPVTNQEQFWSQPVLISPIVSKLLNLDLPKHQSHSFHNGSFRLLLKYRLLHTPPFG